MINKMRLRFLPAVIFAFQPYFQIQGREDSAQEIPSVLGGTTIATRRWMNRTLPFEINPAFSEPEKQIILDGFQMIASFTCIDFVERTTEEDWVHVTRKPQGCWSRIGKGRGGQELNLDPNLSCVNASIVAHEAMHALGCNHEHSRHDRDDYIRINYANIETDWWFPFRKLPENESATYGLKYNYASIMHYDAYAHAIDPSVPTIIPLKPNVTLGDLGGYELTSEDAELVNRMYDCVL